MGKFLRDQDGNLVNIHGGLVLEKSLDRKPRDCEQCGFSRWVKNDKIFIIQRNGGLCRAADESSLSQSPPAFLVPEAMGGGGMEWICPDCALQRGLPPEHYHKNCYATPSPEALRLFQQNQRQRKNSTAATSTRSCQAGWNILELTRYMCNGS